MNSTPLLPQSLPLAPQQVPLITRWKSPVLKDIMGLQSAKERAATKRYFVMGAKLVQRACAFGAPVQTIIGTEAGFASLMTTPAFHSLTQPPLMYRVSEDLMKRLCPTKPTPDQLAVIEMPAPDQDALLRTGDLFLMADRMSLIENMGMLMRTIDATPTAGFILTGEEAADPYHWRTVRASCGGVMTTPVLRRKESIPTMEMLQRRGFQVIATSANQGQPYHKVDMTGPTVILIGNEQSGLPQDALEAADTIAHIPMAGAINSLNVTVAGSLMLYEASRQRTWSF